MFHFLFRLLCASMAAAMAFVVVTVFLTLPIQGDVPQPPWDFLIGLASLGAAIWVFLRVFRRMGGGRMGRRRAEAKIQDLKEEAVERGIGPRATLVAAVLGGGAYATSTLRVTWDGSIASVDAAEGGLWRTVFTGRFHPEVAGEIVPQEIREIRLDRFVEKRSEIITKRVGHRPAHWEVLGYIPGSWEDELDRLGEAAEQARHEGERERFGLQ